MKEYIEREAATNAAVDYLWRGFPLSSHGLAKAINNVPAADVVERKRGEWQHGYNCGQYGIWCSECKAGFAHSEIYEWLAATHNFCPNCGADMRGDSHADNHD